MTNTPDDRAYAAVREIMDSSNPLTTDELLAYAKRQPRFHPAICRYLAEQRAKADARYLAEQRAKVEAR